MLGAVKRQPRFDVRVRRSICAALAWCSWSVLAAQDKSESKEDDPSVRRADSIAGEVAPVGRWYTFGGSASRCGASAATPIFTTRLDVAWDYVVDGEIEEEPLVWDEHIVVVSVKRKEGETAKERTLHVLRLQDGKPLLSPRRVVSDVPLGLSLWNRLIAYREGSNAIRVDQIGATQLGRRMRYETKGVVSPPLLFGNEIYYTQDGNLERIDLGAQQPAWSVAGNFRGRVSLLGDHAFALRFARVTEPTLVLVERFSGKQAVQEGSRLHGPAVDDSADVCIAASRSSALARYDVGARRAGQDHVLNTAAYARISAVGSERLKSTGTWGTSLMPCLLDDTLMMSYDREDSRSAWVLVTRRRGQWRGADVADSERYPDVLKRRVPATLLGDTVVVGDLAFDAETLQVVWQADLQPTQRTIPARQTLLVSAGDRLVAVRDARVLAQQVATQSTARASDKGAVVGQDGRVYRGKFRFDPAAKTVVLGGGVGTKTETLPLAQVLWVEDGETPLYWGDAMAVGRAILLLLEDQMRSGYVGLARRAVQSNDVRTISRYLVEALELGADEKDVMPAQRQIERLRRAPQRTNGAIMSAVDTEEIKVRAGLADLPWARAQALPPGAQDELRSFLALLALRFAPAHPGVTAWVRSRLPEGMVTPEPFAAEPWLIFADANDKRPMRVVAEGDQEYAWELEQLAKARTTWRQDLMAVCSARLCVLAPKEVAGAAARCLATGELVVDALESLFAGIGTTRAGSNRLLVKLYGTRDEYIDRAAQEVLAFEKTRKQREKAEAAKEGEDAGEDKATADEAADAKEAAEALLRQKRGLSLTLGFFVPDEGVTRLFMPAGKEAYEAVVATFAHELTHHWLELRGPRFDRPADVKPRIVRAGHWIVEGFASFVESFVWDVDGQTWNARGVSSDLETFAAASEKQLNPWSRQLTVNQGNMHRRFSKQFEMFIRRAHYLGQRLMSQWGMFYVQGAATCHYLYHAEDGKRRQALLEYVVNYYTGLTEPLTPDNAFDMSADLLGAQVVAWFKTQAPAPAPEKAAEKGASDAPQQGK